MVAIRIIPRSLMRIAGERSLLHWLWRDRGAVMADLLDGDTDGDDEARVARDCLEAVSADQLAFFVQRCGGWAELDSELESAVVTSISKHLARLFDRRDYLPWRLTAGAFADGIRRFDGGAATYLLDDVPQDSWLTVVADLALRQQHAGEHIGKLARLGDGDRAAIQEIQRAADRFAGEDRERARKLFWFCHYVDKAFRATAVADVNTLIAVADEVAHADDSARRNGGLDALAALRDRTVAALLMAAEGMSDAATAAGLLLIRGVLEAGAAVPRHGVGGALDDALAALLTALKKLEQQVQTAAGSIVGVGRAIQNVRIIGSGEDQQFLTALSALAAADLLKWLPMQWKVRLCNTLLVVDATEDDDEQMINQVLRQSRTPAELFHIHSGIGQENLESNIDGAENDQYYAVLNAFTRRGMLRGG